MFFKNPIFLLITAGTILLVSFSLLAGCSGSARYTYEEYKKIKAFNENKQEMTAEDGGNNNYNNLTDSDIFYEDLDSYNSFIGNFKEIYSKYSGLLIPLFENFDNEQADIGKKNQYAESILSCQASWLEEIRAMTVPDILATYHSYFQEYLEKEILFYRSFLNSEIDLSEKYQLESNELYESIQQELKRIESDFNSKATELGIEQPFSQ